MTIRPSPAKPGPGQESVWDDPRPPRLETFVGSITVELAERPSPRTLAHGGRWRPATRAQEEMNIITLRMVDDGLGIADSEGV